MSPLFYQGKLVEKVLIVGMGLSGQSVQTFLSNFSVFVECYDVKKTACSSFKNFTEIDLFSYDLIVVSPGIPLNQSPYQRLMSYRCRMISDVDLFCAYAKEPIIAVTGSNGKSTVVSLLAHILRAQGFKVGLGGNIGAPALSVLDEMNDYYVLELSSFQIDLLHRSYFAVGIVLNITPDHLDRYSDFDAYALSKCSLASFSDCFVCPRSIAEAYSVAHPSLVLFDCDNGFKVDGAFLHHQNTRILDMGAITSLVGQHNRSNIAFTYVAIQSLGVRLGQQAFLDAVQNFIGLPHRCQWVGEVNGVAFIDDSKGTNIGATIAAIEGLSSQYCGIVLLLGGVAKGADFSDMIPTLKAHVRHCFVYGQDGQTIFSQIKDEIQATLCHNANAAFHRATECAQKGELVLLSPACASFDEFRNYAHRGEAFAQFVKSL